MYRHMKKKKKKKDSKQAPALGKISANKFSRAYLVTKLRAATANSRMTDEDGTSIGLGEKISLFSSSLIYRSILSLLLRAHKASCRVMCEFCALILHTLTDLVSPGNLVLISFRCQHSWHLQV